MAIYRGTGSASSTSDQATIDEVTTQATNAANSATSAASSASSAASSASSATSSASTATSQASAASTSATQAASSATAASTSASNASTSETNAATSATTAASSATAATTARTAAEAAQVAAETAETNAETAQAAAETAEANVSATIDAAVATATADAEAAQTAAETAQAAAETAETNAETAQTAAEAAQTAAETAQTNAETAQTNAETAQTAAETAETNAEAALDEFTDLYLGVKSSAPTLDNDGDALQTGALYYDSTAEQLYIWDGSAWDQAAFSVSGAVTSFNTRTGAVTLSSGDVTTALGYTPYNSTNPNSYVVQSDIDTSIANLVDSAPAALDTLNELAAALGDDANFSTTVTNSLATKAPLANPTFTTGIDVTGTVTADGLAIESSSVNTIYASTNQLLNLRDTSAYSIGSNGATLNFQGNDSGTNIRTFSNLQGRSVGFDTGSLVAQTRAGGSLYDRFKIDYNGDISFYEDTGTTPKLFWDASTERLGIGTSSPASTLHINGGGTNESPHLRVTAARGLIARLGDTSGSVQSLFDLYDNDGSTQIVKFISGGGDCFINTGGNVGIGTTSPSDELQVFSSGSTNIAITSGNTGEARLLFGDTADRAIGRIQYANDTNSLELHTNSAEAMRIDSSGNLLVGKTTDAFGTAGTYIGSSGLQVTRSAGSPVFINRLSTNGALTAFYKDGTAIGSIGGNPDGVYIAGKTDTGLFLNDSADSIYPMTTSFVNRDNAIDLGSSSARFKRGYFGATVFAAGVGGVTDTNTYINFPGSDVTQFYTGGTERMRIDSSGDVRINTTSDVVTGYEKLSVNGAGGFKSGDTTTVAIWNTTTTNNGIQFFSGSGGTNVGSIALGSSGTTYNTTSDARLKTDIQPIADATDRLMQMNPVSHKWVADPEADAVVGFIAQEMQEIVPEAVAGDADSDEMMSMDYGRITPVLVAALQDAHKKIEELSAEVKALKEAK